MNDGKLVKAKPMYKKRGADRGVRHLCWKAKPITAHTFNAGNFATMAKENRTHLPLLDALEIMDFAMGYNCIQNGEVQSQHWSPETVTILVCIVYRHATMQADGKVSTLGDPIMIKDFVFAISDDRKQNARVSGIELDSIAHAWTLERQLETKEFRVRELAFPETSLKN